MLKSESDRLNNLAQGIISLARLERSTVSDSANLVHADLSAIVREVVDSLLVQAESKNISVKLNVPETCTVECDEQLISSAISNLLLNAIRYSESKDILVELSLSDNSVSIVVEDYGIGIPPECRERVFDRFYRVDHSRNSSTGGTGLGLAIVRSIAHLHRGEVTLEGANPSGCRFTFTFPAKM
jgi:signal transduction histidine kinase